LNANQYNGLPKGVGIAAAILVLLLLMECAVIYEVRGRMSAIATEVSKLTRQISETEARIVKKEEDRFSLKIENDSLRQELEVAGADLARARDAVRELKAKQQQLTARNRQARATDRKRSVAAPLVFAPPPPTSYRPPRTERLSRLDMADTSLVTTYSIR
jgi:septal ring factor EnvC (AmiA/AmiB activator)